MQKYHQCPIELAQQSVLNSEIIISEQSEKEQQRQALQVGAGLQWGWCTPIAVIRCSPACMPCACCTQKAVEESDDRDWRSRSEVDALPAPAGRKGGREERDVEHREAVSAPAERSKDQAPAKQPAAARAPVQHQPAAHASGEVGRHKQRYLGRGRGVLFCMGCFFEHAQRQVSDWLKPDDRMTLVV